MRLAVIPARGGSKRIPRKNIKLFNGRPIIGFSIDAARESGLFDRVVVSTDDEEIAAVARQLGAEVPFMRPPELSDDHAGTLPVVAHAIHALAHQGAASEFVCCIYPTAPLLQASALREAFNALVDRQHAFAFGVASYGHPIQRALRLDRDGGVSMFEPCHALTRSQDLEAAYHDAGQFCWGTREAFLAGVSPLSSGNAVAVILPRHRVVDIDTPDDWQFAEALHQAFGREGA